MGTQLGAINTMSLETRQELPDAYFSVLKTVKEEQMRGGGGHCWAKVNTVDQGSSNNVAVVY